MIAALILAAATCVPTAQAHERLAEKHHEARVIAGLSDKGVILEIWVAPSGTWTALVTRPDGLSCITDAGKAVTVYPRAAPGDPA